MVTTVRNLNDAKNVRYESYPKYCARFPTAPGLRRVGLTDRSRTSAIYGISPLSVSARRCAALSARSRTGATRSRTNTTVCRTRTPNRRALRPCWFLEMPRTSLGLGPRRSRPCAVIRTEKIRRVVHHPARKMLYAEAFLIDRFRFEQPRVVSMLGFHFSQVQLDRPVDGTFHVQHAQQPGSLRTTTRAFFLGPRPSEARQTTNGYKGGGRQKTIKKVRIDNGKRGFASV